MRSHQRRATIRAEGLLQKSGRRLRMTRRQTAAADVSKKSFARAYSGALEYHCNVLPDRLARIRKIGFPSQCAVDPSESFIIARISSNTKPARQCRCRRRRFTDLPSLFRVRALVSRVETACAAGARRTQLKHPTYRTHSN